MKASDKLKRESDDNGAVGSGQNIFHEFLAAVFLHIVLVTTHLRPSGLRSPTRVPFVPTHSVRVRNMFLKTAKIGGISQSVRPNHISAYSVKIALCMHSGSTFGPTTKPYYCAVDGFGLTAIV